MLLRRIALATALAVGLAAGGSTATLADKGPWKGVLGEADFVKLVNAEAAFIKKTLDGGIEKKPAQNKARVAALMVAAYAQSAMLHDAGKAGQLAGLRDQAIALADAIGAGKTDEAKKLAESMTPTAAGKTGAKAEAVDLSKHIDLNDLMNQFKPEAGVGRGLEAKLKKVMQKRAALSPADLQEATLSAWQMAIIAQYTEALAPEKDEGPKKKADWIKWSQEMGDLSVVAAKAAGAAKTDDKAVKLAFKKLDENCVRCHNVFKEN